MPKVGGGLPLSMPALGNLSKAPAGLPGSVGGLLSGTGMKMPAPLSMEGAAPKVQSKSQMPGGSTMAGTIPKMQGLAIPGMGGAAQQPLASAAVAAATAKASAPA